MIFAKRGLSLILQCMIAIEVLILFTLLPVLFHNLSFNLLDYCQSVYQLTIRVFTFDTFTTFDGKSTIFPFIIYRYFDSMRLVVLGFITASLFSFLLSYLAIIFFKRKIRILKRILEIAEAIPDLMIILLLQMVVISIYKTTGIKLARLTSIQEDAILLPLLSISIPISFYITKILIHHIEEELEKDYIILAKSKGFSLPYILNVHILRNIADGMFINSKTILWSMLSSLLVIDYLFNLNGLLTMMLTGTDPFIIGSILLFLPVLILYRIYEWMSFEQRRDRS